MADAKTLASLKKLLYSSDLDSILQGIEFVVSLDDPALWNTLLDGVTWSADRDEGTGPGLVPNRFFSGPVHMRPFRELAMTLLVAHSPKNALKGRVKALKFRLQGAERRSDWKLTALPLAGIERYPNLARVDLEIVPKMEEVFEALARCQSLHTLTLRHRYYGDQLRDLVGIAACRTLQALHIECDLLSLSGIEGAAIEELSIASPHDLDVGPLCTLRALRKLSLRHIHIRKTSSAPAPLPALASLHLSHVSAEDLFFLSGAPLLDAIDVEGSTMDDLTVLAELPSLRGLPSWATGPGLDRLLEVLEARGTEAIFDRLLGPVALHEGLLSACGWARNTPAHDRAIRRLVSVARGREAERVCGLLPPKQLLFPDRSTGTADLRGIGRFHTVTEIEIPDADAILGLEELGRLPALRRLTLSGKADLAALPKMPALEEIVLSPVWKERRLLSCLRDQPSLRRVVIGPFSERCVEIPAEIVPLTKVPASAAP